MLGRSKFTSLRIKFARKVKGKVLDCGAGVGDYQQFFNTRDITSLDINVNQLKHIKGQKICADATKKLPFKDNAFDVLFAFGLIQYLKPYINLYINEWKRIVKSGGKIYILTPNQDSILDRIIYLILGKSWKSEFGVKRLYSAKELSQFGRVYGEIWFLPFLNFLTFRFPILGHTLIAEIDVKKMINKKYKFIITTSNLQGNLGGVAMTVALSRGMLKLYPGSEIFLVCKYFDKDINTVRQFYFPREKVKLILLSQAYITFILLPLAYLYKFFKLGKNHPVLKHFINADYILDTGGITFSDELGLSGLVINSTLVLIAEALKKPNLKVSQAYGPLSKPLNCLVSKIMLRKIDLIISRGENSSHTLKRLGIKNFYECADLAFLTQSVVSSKTKKITRGKKDFVLGIAPNAVLATKLGQKQLIDLITVAVEKLVKQKPNLKIWLIGNSYMNGKITDNNDQFLLEDIALQWKEKPIFKNKVSLIMGDYTPYEMKEIIGKTDLFLACRFHSQVFAFSMGVPTVAIGWGEKYLEVQKQFSLNLHLNYHWITSSNIYKLLYEAIKKRARIKKTILQKLPQVQRSAQTNFTYIKKFIDGEENK